MNETKKWIPELQSFSGLAIIFVVLIHATAYYLLSVLNKTSFEEVDYITRLVDNLIHGAVPMFIFIAGYKYSLNNLEISYKKFAKSRLKKVIKPFLLISGIFFIKSIINGNEQPNIVSLSKNFLEIFIGYNPAYQLWYIPMYIIIVLTYPIICRSIKSEKAKIMLILGIIAIQYTLSWYSDLLAGHPFDFVYYYLYFHMGVLFCRYDVKSKMQSMDMVIIAMYIIVTLIITLNTSDYLSSPLKRFILWPMSVIGYYFFVLRIKKNKLLQYLGKYSFYIFLLHEPIFCTDISYIFKIEGFYHSITESFIIGVLTIIVTMIIYKIIEWTSIKKIVF